MSKRTIAYLVGGVAAVLVAVIGAVLLFSGGDDTKVVAAAPSSSTSTTATTLPPLPPLVAPLTGLPVEAEIPRPALVVKVDNADAKARPQAGLNHADVVYEEKVEGGVTRFAAVFHSDGSDPVGPVRSGRTTDVGIVGPLHVPLYAYSGANATAEGILAGAPLINVGAPTHPEAYYRMAGRQAPDNLFSSTEALWGLTPPDAQAPTPIFLYRGDGDQPAGEPVSRIDVDFGGGAGGAPVRYLWDPAAKTWFRWQNGTEHVDDTGTQFAPQNVILQFVDYVDTGQKDVAGNPVPEAQLVGEGDVWVFSDGRQVVGRWKRDAPDAPTSFVDAAGQPILITPGRTWVELVPVGSPASVETCAQNPGAVSCSAS